MAIFVHYYRHSDIKLDYLPLRQYNCMLRGLPYCHSGENVKTTQSIGSIVRYHRKRSGLSQEGLAKMAGLGKTVVYDIEKGKETVQVDTLKKILGVLNITIVFESPLMAQYEKENPR